MSVTSLPRETAQLLSAAVNVGVNPWQILIVGQMGATGTATTKGLYKLDSLTDTQITTYYGPNSDMTNRILRARSIIGGRCSIFAIGLSAAAGTAATFSQAISGTSTVAGTITVNAIAPEFTFTVDIPINTAAAAVGPLITAAIANLSDTFPATVAGTATLTWTSSDVGTIQNQYTVRVDNVPAGLVIPSGQFSGGATDPTLTTIFDNAVAERFHAIQWPWATTTVVDNFLSPRNTINNAFLQGVAFFGKDDTEANLISLVNGVTPLNSANQVYISNRMVSTVSQIVTPPNWRATEFMAIEALRMTPNAPIGNYVVTTSPRDVFGGPGSASLPYFNTPMAKTALTDPALLFLDSEQDALKNAGISIIGVNESKTSMIMGEVVTTYKFNSRGEADTSFKYLEYVRTGYTALELFFRRLKSDYAQSRLTAGDVISNRSMTNAAQIAANCSSIYKLLSEGDYVLTQAGEQAEKYFFANLTVTPNLSTGSVTITGLLPIVTQIRNINISFQLSFGIGS
jgi:phage tail sheath gpL-like